MRKNKLFRLVCLLILALLTGCAEQSTDTPAESRPAYTGIVSSVAQEDCWLCGNRTDTTLYPYLGQNNVGLVSLNTFEVMPVVINRYDMDGTLLEELTGVMASRHHSSQEDGFLSHSFEDVDRGYAHGSVTFNEDKMLDVEKTAALLCQDCLDGLLAEIYKEGYGVGIVNFETRELRAFEQNFTGFGLGDFYIDCDFNGADKPEYAPDINFLIFYAPLRYES